MLKFINFYIKSIIIFFIVATFFLLSTLWYFSIGLPDYKKLSNYQPPISSRVYSEDGKLIAEYALEKRLFVPFDSIPTTVINSFLSAEDKNFFNHPGIDAKGILRALINNIKNISQNKRLEGASTITQQVAKSLIVEAEGYKQGTAKKLSRKIKEAILARRLEESLSKEDILTLYLNQIFLGNHSYGIQAAAENYFRKNVDALNLAEMALLAGLPQAPSRYSPFRYPERARKRRIYVLRRMKEEGFISAEELQAAEDTQIRVYGAPNTSRDVTPYFTEHVRRWLMEKYGQDKVLNEGLSVWTTVDVERYRAAEDAIYSKLRMVDKRQGFRGPLLKLKSQAEQKSFLDKYSKELLRLGQLEELKNDSLVL